MKLNAALTKPQGIQSAQPIQVRGLGVNAAQNTMNQLLIDIEQTRAALSELTSLQEAHRMKRRLKLLPLLKQYDFANLQMIYFLGDRLQDPEGLSIKQQNDLAQVGLILIDRLTHDHPIDANLNRTIDQFKHHQQSAKLVRGTGPEFADEADQWPESEEDDSFDHDDATFSFKKQTKKSRTKPEKSEGAQTQIDAQAALRAVYRKLASALHPDRELDDAERLRKTALMARVNSANDLGDLSALMQMQAQLITKDTQSGAILSNERLQSLALGLNEQLARLTDEIKTTENSMRAEFGMGYGAINAKTLKLALRADLAQIQGSVDSLVDTLHQIQTHRNLKVWLRQQLQWMENQMA
jgi:hypothetical protein